MKPGKELDILVATKVMGWRQHPDFPHLFADTKLKDHAAFQVNLHIPKYSTDLDLAWKVVEQILREGHPWAPHFSGIFHDKVDLETLPFKICVAALKSVGVET